MWSPEVQFMTHSATRGMVQDTMPEEHLHCQSQRRRAADQMPVFDALGARTGCVRDVNSDRLQESPILVSTPAA